MAVPQNFGGSPTLSLLFGVAKGLSERQEKERELERQAALDLLERQKAEVVMRMNAAQAYSMEEAARRAKEEEERMDAYLASLTPEQRDFVVGGGKLEDFGIRQAQEARAAAAAEQQARLTEFLIQNAERQERLARLPGTPEFGQWEATLRILGERAKTDPAIAAGLPDVINAMPGDIRAARAPFVAEGIAAEQARIERENTATEQLAREVAGMDPSLVQQLVQEILAKPEATWNEDERNFMRGVAGLRGLINLENLDDPLASMQMLRGINR